MKKNIYRTLTLFVAVLMLCACQGTGRNANNGVVVTNSINEESILVGNIPCTFPMVKDNTSMNVLVTGYGDIKAENVYVWEKYEEMTHVHINWTTVKKSERNEAVYQALANKSKLDLIMRCKIGASELMKYGESGFIYDLAKDGMLEKNAPNCWAYLQSHPDALASVTNPDGTIYALPQINSGAELRVSRKFYVNKNWLNNVNMEIPTTTEEFYQMLKAFKEQDANGNGDSDDEIPLCPQDWSSIQEALLGSFGLANRGIHNVTVDCDETTGKVRLIATTDGYKTYLEFLNKLYSEGLLDSYVFTIKMEQWSNNAAKDQLGVFSSTNLASLPTDQVNNWVAIEEPLEGPNGDKLWSAIRANFHSTGAALIPTTCDNPELVLKWLDYFWTDEGTLFYHMGIENETFKVKEDGAYDYEDIIYDKMKTENISFDDAVSSYSPYPGGSNPTVEIAPYFMGGEMAEVPSNAARKLFEYGPKEYWPSFTFTKEENERLSVLQSDISKYVTTTRLEFITGEKSFSDWDAYVVQVNEMGSQELLDIYQAAVDRYHAMQEE